jgi:hypothetical protein
MRGPRSNRLTALKRDGRLSEKGNLPVISYPLSVIRVSVRDFLREYHPKEADMVFSYNS